MIIEGFQLTQDSQEQLYLVLVEKLYYNQKIVTLDGFFFFSVLQFILSVDETAIDCVLKLLNYLMEFKNAISRDNMRSMNK